MHAQKDVPSLTRHDVKLALIAAGEAQDPTLPALPNVDEEIRETVYLAERSGITILSDTTGSHLSTKNAAGLFESANFVHVSCHGLQHPTEPLQSAFCLSDGHLTVEELMHNELKDAFFSFLSACETAKGDKDQPDQAIHLAATMLCVGFKSIVATMW
jgi:CHAT domain-containing protein